MIQLDRVRPAMRRVGSGTLLLLLSAGAAHMAAAQTSFHGGQTAVLSNPSSTPMFSVSGNTVTVTFAGAPTFLSINNGPFLQLLGIDGIWIVDAQGNAIPGVATVAGGGSVSNSAPAFPWAETVLPPPGYITASGFPSNGTWLQLASNADVLAGSGKTESMQYTVGTFTFAGLSGLRQGIDYSFGIDYLQANGSNGNTGRAYFAIPGTPSPVPEPGAVATVLAMGGTTALGLLRGRRRRRAL